MIWILTTIISTALFLMVLALLFQAKINIEGLYWELGSATVYGVNLEGDISELEASLLDAQEKRLEALAEIVGLETELSRAHSNIEMLIDEIKRLESLFVQYQSQKLSRADGSANYSGGLPSLGEPCGSYHRRSYRS